MSIRPYGVPKTEEERRATHEALYGTTELPPRGTGILGGGRPFGVPKTEAERRATHYAQYGTTTLPPRGTGLVGNPVGVSLNGKTVLLLLFGLGGLLFVANKLRK